MCQNSVLIISFSTLPFSLVLPVVSFVCGGWGSNWNILPTHFDSQFEICLTAETYKTISSKFTVLSWNTQFLVVDSRSSSVCLWESLELSWNISRRWKQLFLLDLLGFWGTRQLYQSSKCPCGMGLLPIHSPRGTHPIGEFDREILDRSWSHKLESQITV